jgi:UDP-glucose 4-epimerase
MKILVTGSSGFLGKSIVNKAITLGYEVLELTRNTENPFNKILSFGPDVVFHCAWSGGNNYKDINDISQLDNVHKGVELIETLRMLPTKTKFVGFGSFAEYGLLKYPANETLKEEPVNLYGLTKYTYKNYSKFLCDKYQIDWLWVRPCYIYGPGDVNTRLIPRLISVFNSNQEMTLDECNTIIDYLYVEDFVNLLFKLTLSGNTGVYNLCSGNQYELKEIISLIHNLTNSKSNITYDSTKNRISVSNYICGDNSKVLKDTKHNASLISLKEGILETIKIMNK